jgi:hypothetical protein
VVVTVGQPARGVYPTLLGRAFDTLHPNVREAHLAPLYAEGTMDVVHGTHRLARFFVGLMHLPAPGPAKPVTLRVTEAIDGAAGVMHWNRVFGKSRLRTCQSAWRGLLLERSGPGSITYRLRVDDGALVYEQTSMRVLNLPISSGMTPNVRARASGASTGWHVDVIVEWRGYLVCRYTGRMAAVRGTS